MATIYYIDSINGSDSNTGTSPGAALQSIAAVENLQLHPGDQVLFARGTTYAQGLDIKDSGSPANPIVFGAYGTGDPPLFNGANLGIVGTKTHDIIVRDLEIAHTTSSAIYAHGASNWTVQNVVFSDCGTASHSGAIRFAGGSNVTLKGNTITGTTGDGIYIDGVSGITIANNRINTVHGHDADNIQVENASNVSIVGNTLDMSGQTDSTKGNLAVNHSDGVDIEHNTMIGGSYGAGVNSDNVTIAYNEVFGQSGYTWSFGIGISQKWSVSNYSIHDNYVHDVNFGVAITGWGTFATRTNIEVTNNIFADISSAVLKVDRPATGDFAYNKISFDSPILDMSPDNVAAGTFVVGDNGRFFERGLTLRPDEVTAGTRHVVVHGDVLSNDGSWLGRSSLTVTEMGGKLIVGGTDIQGKFGTLHVDASGHYTYTLDISALTGVTTEVKDVFSYIVSNGQQESLSTLTIDLLAPTAGEPPAGRPGIGSGPSTFAEDMAISPGGDAGGHDGFSQIWHHDLSALEPDGQSLVFDPGLHG